MKINFPYLQFIKPLIDFSAAFVLLVVLFPILVSISLVLMALNQPVIFRHRRPGYREAIFEMYKFSSMINDEEEKAFPFGRFLRKTSLDELPQLFNVLKGQMSLVGPRPLLIEYLDEYTPEQRLRHRVKPGITGWAQVCGRNALSFDEKISYDLYYVKHISPGLDLRILYKSFFQLIKWSEADFHALSPSKLKTKVG